MASVRIDRDQEGWRYTSGDIKGSPTESYPQCVRLAVKAGHIVDNAGWLHRLLMWNFNRHALDGYPEWEIEADASPDFAKLAHVRGSGAVESHQLACAWDDVAAVDFYQRDWTDDGLPTVRKDDIYWSGWWFATIAERDRFLQWVNSDAGKAVR